jgi:hypothetical protein
MGRFVVLIGVLFLCFPSAVPGQMLPAGCLGLPNLGPLSLNAQVGWLEHRAGNSWSYNFAFDRNGNDQQWVDRSPIRGTWLELSASGAFSQNMRLAISGGLLVPSRLSGQEDEDVAGESYGLEMNEMTWGMVEAVGSYNVYGDLEVLGGFRWDRFSTTAEFVDQSQIYFQMTTYLPLVGLQLGWRSPEHALITKILGWPTAMPGDMRFSYVGAGYYPKESGDQSFAEGYFLEMFAEYTVKVFEKGSAGVFVKWNNLHLNASKGSHDWARPSGRGTAPLQMSADRTSWTFGGSLTVDVAFP